MNLMNRCIGWIEWIGWIGLFCQNLREIFADCPLELNTGPCDPGSLTSRQVEPVAGKALGAILAGAGGSWWL